MLSTIWWETFFWPNCEGWVKMKTRFCDVNWRLYDELRNLKVESRGNAYYSQDK